MKKLTNVYQIDAFTDEPFRGNAAGVVYTDELSTGGNAVHRKRV